MARDAGFGAASYDVLHFFEEAAAVGFQLVRDELTRRSFLRLRFSFGLRLASRIQTQLLSTPPSNVVVSRTAWTAVRFRRASLQRRRSAASLERGMRRRVAGKCGKRELPVIRETRNTDADEPQRARPIVQRAVEQSARELADLLRVVDSHTQ